MSKAKSSRPLELVISCEHGGNTVPAKYAPLFATARDALNSHRGYDPGSLELGRHFAKKFAAPIVATTVTRLLIEVNRTIGHKSLFSEWSAQLDADARQVLIKTYYEPHRNSVEEKIRKWIDAKRRVVHLSMHTFTPVLNGETRRADVGLLFDPQRPGETKLCRQWQQQLETTRPDLVVRRNYPYRGAADGFTTALRKRYSDRDYLGIELELNQKWVAPGTTWRNLIRDVANSFAAARDLF